MSQVSYEVLFLFASKAIAIPDPVGIFVEGHDDSNSLYEFTKPFEAVTLWYKGHVIDSTVGVALSTLFGTDTTAIVTAFTLDPRDHISSIVFLDDDDSDDEGDDMKTDVDGNCEDCAVY